MRSQNTVDFAIAIRMTCSNPDIKGASGFTPVVLFAADGKPSDNDVIVPSDASPDSVIDALSKHMEKNGAPPQSVTVDGLGSFSISIPEVDLQLSGIVSLVTGSAQGFGKGIAEGLLSHGTRVVIADLNEELGRATVKEFSKEFGDDSVIFANMNVTDLASINRALEETVLSFGGIDLFISNAGVLKAGPLDEMDEKSFDLVTSVNYKGYFLGAKAVSGLMKKQYEYNPSHMMDIIQINSKSGLEGSNKNFAYAGSKFGGIGLTQSFALELIPFNIKVNAICPGNFFDGPLWSDPEKGLFVQYLEAGKIPGAKTIEDVKKAYVDKVPMRRGCLPEDVLKAILYLQAQTYETGQALPVTGGQVMLK